MMNERETTYSFDEYVAEQMEEPSFRAEYEALEEEFAFIRQLIELRRQKGLTQAELAEQVGTRQPSISRLEHGQLGSFEFLRRVTEALDVQVESRLAPKKHSSSSS
jgi:DNA-binding XRE family transcriptional regulator